MVAIYLHSTPGTSPRGPIGYEISFRLIKITNFPNSAELIPEMTIGEGFYVQGKTRQTNVLAVSDK
jgi:hypothetical protein